MFIRMKTTTKYGVMYRALIFLSLGLAQIYDGISDMEPCHFNNATCACNRLEEGIEVNCRKRRLEEIPKFETNVIWIDLSQNQIQSIQSNGLPKRLTYLDISWNDIQNLSGYPFRNLTELRFLNLEGNFIKIDSYYEGMFEHLTSLETLNMKWNDKDMKINVIPEHVFAELRSLSILRIDGPKNVTFGERFTALQHLKVLDLSGMSGFCNLVYVRYDTFENLPYLKVLDISNCSIRDIDEGSFSVLPNLQYLNISYNRQLGFASLPNITIDLNKTQIKTLQLNGINCMMGVGTEIKCHHLIHLKDTNITEISVASNRLEIFEEGVLRNFPKTLQKLSVAENKMTIGNYLLEMSYLRNLKVYNISYLKHSPLFPYSVFDTCKEKSESRDDKVFTCPKYQSPGFDEKNFIKFETLNWTINLPGQLEEIHARDSKMYLDIPEFSIHGPSLKYLYFQNNFIFSWKGPVHAPNNTLIEMDMSNNFCAHFNPPILRDGQKMRKLNLSFNEIGKALEKDIEGQTFQSLISLENLDLSFCKISSLPSNIFRNAPKLMYLNISNNQISKWTVNMYHFNKLILLDLAENRLRTIEEGSRNQMKTTFQTTNLSVDLSGNHLECSCENKDFLMWVQNNKDHFINIRNYICYENKLKFSFKNLDVSVSSMERDCRSFMIWYIVVSVFSAVFSSSIIGVLLVKNKWKIRYLVHKSKQKLRFRDRLNSHTSTSITYDYDAFLSYASTERTFVLKDVMPRLESNSSIRLLVRDRDYLPGTSKSDCIMNGLHESRRAICIVSKRYLNSKWRDYELNMAKVEGIKDRGRLDFVILILLPEVYNGGYPSKIMDLVKKNCYLEYPEESCGYDDFWEKLIQILTRGD